MAMQQEYVQVLSTSMLLHSSDLPNIENSLHQLCHFKFPKHPFGKKTVVLCSFQAVWLDCW